MTATLTGAEWVERFFDLDSGRPVPDLAVPDSDGNRIWLRPETPLERTRSS